MAKKSKYDVMYAETKGSTGLILKLAFKFMALTRKLDKNQISEEDMNFEVAKMLNKLMPFLKVTCHIGYENCKDIENIDKDNLFSYLEKNGVDKATFSYNYSKKLNETVKLLAMFAIFDKENVSLPDVNSSEIAIQILEGGDIRDLISDCLEDLSEESLELLDEAFDEDFNAREMSNELKEVIETYHNNYMNEHVYPKVTKEVTPEKQIIKTAKSLGRKSR